MKNHPPSHQDPLLQELQLLRSQRALPLAAVANKSGVSASTLRNWDTGKTKRPLVSTLSAVAKVYGLRLALVGERSAHGR